MPATKTRHFGQLDSEFTPFATAGSYCRTVVPVSPDVSFDAGHVLPKEIRDTAGSCGFAAPVPSQAESPPSWGLPSMTGMSPALGLTRYWSTLDSTIAGNGPRPGGWRQPEIHRTHPGVAAQAAGGKKGSTKGKSKAGSRKTRRRPSKKGKSKRGRVSRKAGRRKGSRAGSRKGSRRN